MAHRIRMLAAAAALLGTLAGGLAHLLGAGWAGSVGDALWIATIAGTLIPVTWSVGRALAHGDVGVDVIALLAMAAALAGGELLAGSVVAVMLLGGNALEAYAAGRAERELTALLRRAPRIAHRRRGGTWEEVPVEQVVPGDLVLVRGGEVVPVDGTLASPRAALDASAVSGGRQLLRRARRARRRRPARASAVHAPRRPLRGDLPAAHAARRGRRVGGERRLRARGRGARRRDAVPADPRRSDRARLGPLALRATATASRSAASAGCAPAASPPSLLPRQLSSPTPRPVARSSTSASTAGSSARS